MRAYSFKFFLLQSLALSALLSCLPVKADLRTPVVPAELLNAWLINGSEGLDISGLSFCDGELLAVADKISTKIYRLTPQSGKLSTSLLPRAEFTPPGLPVDQPSSLKVRILHTLDKQLQMDFEGITCDDEQIYLLSERHNRIVLLKKPVDKSNTQVADGLEQKGWLPEKWSEAARAQGYLLTFNAESEGLVKIGNNFWVALEREPRGLLKLPIGKPLTESDFFTIPPVSGLAFYGRGEDVTGLAYYDGALFTLERNAFAVCRRSLQTLVAEWCVNYRNIEESPEYIYQDTNYAKAEGLAVSSEGIFVVLDNNRLFRKIAPEDNRGLLLQFAFPAESLLIVPSE